MELDKYEARSRLDMDISNNRDIALRSEGYPSDAISTGLAAAIVLTGMGIGWALSKSKEMLDR